MAELTHSGSRGTLFAGPVLILFVVEGHAMLALDPDIAELDLEPIAFKACMDEGWDIEKVDRITLRYRRFLQAIRNEPDTSLAPSRDVDLFWHHHILDTRKYIEDCRRLFGEYIHHFPYSGIRGDKDAQEQDERFQRSQRLMDSSQQPSRS